MKKILMACAFMLCSCIVGPTYAAELERLEFGVTTPLQPNQQIVNSVHYQNWTANSDIRVALIDTKIGKFGIEAQPSYDFRNSILTASEGVYYEPWKNLQLHVDHVSPVTFSRVSGNSFSGYTTAGLRYIIK